MSKKSKLTLLLSVVGEHFKSESEHFDPDYYKPNTLFSHFLNNHPVVLCRSSADCGGNGVSGVVDTCVVGPTEETAAEKYARQNNCIGGIDLPSPHHTHPNPTSLPFIHEQTRGKKTSQKVYLFN